MAAHTAGPPLPLRSVPAGASNVSRLVQRPLLLCPRLHPALLRALWKAYGDSQHSFEEALMLKVGAAGMAACPDHAAPQRCLPRPHCMAAAAGAAAACTPNSAASCPSCLAIVFGPTHPTAAPRARWRAPAAAAARAAAGGRPLCRRVRWRITTQTPSSSRPRPTRCRTSSRSRRTGCSARCWHRSRGAVPVQASLLLMRKTAPCSRPCSPRWRSAELFASVQCNRICQTGT